MSTIRVRKASIQDAKHIAEIGAATFASSFAHSMPAEHMEIYLQTTFTADAIAKEMDDSAGNRFYVAVTAQSQEDLVVGFIQMKVNTTEPCIPRDINLCEIHRIYISVQQIGGGVGQKLMEVGLQWSRKHLEDQSPSGLASRKSAIWLGVWDENVRAQRFYTRFGFERIGAHDFVIGDTTQTDYVMIKWIS